MAIYGYMWYPLNPQPWAKDAKECRKNSKERRVPNFWWCKIDHCRQIHCCFGRWRRCIFSSTTVSNKARTGPDVVLIAFFESSRSPSWMLVATRKSQMPQKCHKNVTKWKSLLLEPCPQLPSKSIVLKKTVWNNLQKNTNMHVCARVPELIEKRTCSGETDLKELQLLLRTFVRLILCCTWVYVMIS